MRFKLFLEENEGGIIAYHGSPEKIGVFSTSFLGSGHDQEGPGIYFTTSIEDAGRYGGNVHRVILRPRKLVPLSGRINIEQIKKLILSSLNLSDERGLFEIDINDFYESGLSDWDEKPIEAFRKAVNSIGQYSKSPHDAFQNVWYSFFKNEPQKYLEQMVKLGYDGVKVSKTGLDHYIVFNPNIILKKD
jgi:hypothetical protein